MFAEARRLFSRRDVLFGLAMAAAVWGAMPTFWEAFTPPDFSRGWRQDCDRVLIYQGLRECPRFRDTLRWWTGTWVGKVPFWRPLTSLFFWAEWKLFGWEDQDAWALVHGLSWVIAVAVFFAAVDALSGPIVALLAVLFLCVPGPRVGLWRAWMSLAHHSLSFWKDTVDVWLLAASGLAILAALRAPRWAVLASAVPILIKETGYAVSPVVAVLLWHRARRGLAACTLAVWGALGIAHWQIIGIGYIYGSNRMLWTRLWGHVAPLPLNIATSSLAPWALLAAGAACLLCLGGWLRTLGPMLVGMAAWANGNIISQPIGIGAAGLAVHYLITVTWPVLLWIVGAAYGLSPLVVLWAYASFLAAIPPSLAPQARYHCWLLASAWGCAAAAVAWCNVWRRFARK